METTYHSMTRRAAAHDYSRPGTGDEFRIYQHAGRVGGNTTYNRRFGMSPNFY